MNFTVIFKNSGASGDDIQASNNYDNFDVRVVLTNLTTCEPPNSTSPVNDHFKTYFPEPEEADKLLKGKRVALPLKHTTAMERPPKIELSIHLIHLESACLSVCLSDGPIGSDLMGDPICYYHVCLCMYMYVYVGLCM